MQGENTYILFLKKIWPTIYRGINALFYFILSIIKSLVSGAINQIKNF